MSKRTCPNCQKGLRYGNALIRCSKCGTIFCQSCAKGFTNKNCPTCGTKANNSDLINRS